MIEKEQLVLTPKNSEHPENCMITATMHSSGEYCVEIYNVFGDYHSLKPIQLDIKEGSKWHKYKNKRYMLNKDELNKKYRITFRIFN